MPRPSQLTEKRRELMPVLARAFADLGYRKATTAALAEACGVQENILYRLWPDKRAMFVAAIEYTYDFSEQTWLRLLAERTRNGTAAERLVGFESLHHGEFGHYRIAFAALSECGDPAIYDALKRMYTRFHRFLYAQILNSRDGERGHGLNPEIAAWAAIGLGTVANIGRELGILSDADRKRLIGEVGRHLLEGGQHPVTG